MSEQKFETTALHNGYVVEQTTGARAVPIYQTTSYVFRDTDHAANLFNLSEKGHIYTRLNNPTNDVLEQRISALEGGIGGLAFASGMGAITAALLTILKQGDHIVSSSSLYGGTYNLLKVTLPRLGIETTFVDQSDTAHFKNALKKNTRAIYLETIGNPRLDVPDFEKISKIASEAGIPVLVDNTVATPYLCNPLKYGANIVIHSLTKYIGGHGNSIGGIIIDGGNFDWGNGHFPDFTEPSPGYHGLKYWKTLGPASFISKARIETIRDTGAALSPYNAFEFLQGLETLSLRVERHCQNALKVAQFLQSEDQVKWVSYDGLESHPSFQLAKKYLENGYGGLVTFGLKGGYREAKSFVDHTQLFSLVANIGDSRSLIIHPASTTHQQLEKEERESTGVTDDLIRLSIGIEHIDDIIADLKKALEKVAGEKN